MQVSLEAWLPSPLDGTNELFVSSGPELARRLASRYEDEILRAQ
jgi:hypothetical protein